MPGDLISINAIVCERVLEERDGTLSAIRIFDNVEFQAGTTPTSEFNAIVRVKSTLSSTQRKMRVTLKTPSGKDFAVADDQPIRFAPGGTQEPALYGAQIVFKITIRATETGTYWVIVQIDGIAATSVPITFMQRSEQDRPNSPSQQP